MRPRLRRLTSDFERVQAAFSDHPHIRLMGQEGDPPDRYLFELLVPGFELPEPGTEPTSKAVHQVEVILPLEYPRRPPFCRMLTPVYHPNINPAKICIGDHWSAGQSLTDLITRIAEMICFQSYNVKSPLNAEAAAWAEQNQDNFPLLAADLGSAADASRCGHIHDG
jgi:ubiquitin-protein ligase